MAGFDPCPPPHRKGRVTSWLLEGRLAAMTAVSVRPCCKAPDWVENKLVSCVLNLLGPLTIYIPLPTQGIQGNAEMWGGLLSDPEPGCPWPAFCSPWTHPVRCCGRSFWE